MAETFPRFGLPAVDFLTVDASSVESSIVTGYENASGRSLASGDPVRLFLLSVASAIVQLRAAVNAAAQQNLLSYAQGDYLESLGAIFGVSRLPAASASAPFLFSLSQALGEDYTVPAGTLVGNGIATFATDADLTIAAGSTSGSVSATCTASGEDGNGYVAGQISTILEPMAYLESASNTSETAGGSSVESDESLAARIRLAPNAFSTAGPEKAYVYHAYSAHPSVTDVSVLGNEDEPGHVRVYVLENGGTPSQEVLDAVEERLSADDVRPLTDAVHVAAPTASNFDVKVEYWLSESDRSRAESIHRAVQSAAAEYGTWQTSAIGRDIDPGKLVSMVMDAGAARIDLSTMHPSAYLELSRSQVAKCTAYTVTFKGYKDI